VPRAVLIDTDSASDDAVALIMALRAPDVDVRAITIVAGNVPVAQAARNALYTAELCGSDVPAYPGAEHSDAARIHARQMVPRQRRPGRS
jgi:purine nucleosidase